VNVFDDGVKRDNWCVKALRMMFNIKF